MKKIFSFLSVFALLASFAGESTVEVTAQVFGSLPIYSTASNVIVSVPWVAASNTGTNAISVAEIIKTAGLTAGDWIRSWDAANNRFNVWTLVDNGGVLEWQAAKTVTENGVQGASDSTATYLKRGDALILYRQHPENNDGVISVYGQYKALSSSDTTTVTPGSSTTPAYTLIAPPMTTAVDLNADVTWGEINSADRLVYGESATVGTQYRYMSGTGWGYYKYESKSGKTTFVAAPSVPAGIGFWYVSKGGSPTITWTSTK